MSDRKLDLDKLRSIGHLSRGRTRPRVREGRDSETGDRFKSVTDELGHTVTERGHDRQDVTINARPAQLRAAVNKEG